MSLAPFLFTSYTTEEAAEERRRQEYARQAREIDQEKWKKAVFEELDNLLNTHRSIYARIPEFLDSPDGEISGMSYRSCFYGKVAHSSEQAQGLAAEARHNTKSMLAGIGLSTIEHLVMALYPFNVSYGPNITPTIFKGWIKEHFDAHPDSHQRIFKSAPIRHWNAIMRGAFFPRREAQNIAPRRVDLIPEREAERELCPV